jgi:hypothetical protein
MWRQHQWTRYRIAMHLLARELKATAAALGREDYAALLDFDAAPTEYTFEEHTEWKGAVRPSEHALAATAQLVRFIEDWEDLDVFSGPRLPSPMPRLVVRRGL